VPEGDTVHRTARRLDRALSGHVLERTDFRVPQLATVDLRGSTVLRTVSRGKHLLTRIDADQPWTLHTHLMMEGTWHVHPRGERWRRPVTQARVVLETVTTTAVGFSLGVVELVPRHTEQELLAHLGPDLLGPDWDEAEAVRRLRADHERPLAEALLDQRNLAGIGNMYAAELCFLAGVAPEAPVAAVPDLTRLVRRARQVLEANTVRAIQSTTGDLRPGERTWVYRRDRAGCRRCGGPVQVGALGDPGRERATYWCPRCQPVPD